MTMLTHEAPTARSRSTSASAVPARQVSRSGSREPATGGASRSRSPNAAATQRSPQPSRGSSADRFYRALPATANAPLYAPKGMGDVQRVGRNGPLTQTAPRFLTAAPTTAAAAVTSSSSGSQPHDNQHNHHNSTNTNSPQYLSQTTRDREEKNLSTYHQGPGAVASFRSTMPRFRDPVVNQAPFRTGPSFVDEILRR